MLSLGGRVEMGKSGPYTHMQWLRIWKDITAAKVPLRSKGSQFNGKIPSSNHQCWEEVPT